MIQNFDLTGSPPDIPNPHDCVIDRIYQDIDCIVFEFVKDITRFDSARFYCPAAKSLRVRYHFSDMDFRLYQAKTRKRSGDCVTVYTSMPDDELIHLTERKHKLEYLYHYVSYKSMILVLCSGQELRLELNGLDHVEYHWIETSLV